MFTHYDTHQQLKPIKIWLEDIDQVEEECLKQATNLSNLPFTHHHVALMPDTHSGYGMPIGGVLATQGVIIPNAVGVDIGCGMLFMETNIHKSELTQEDYQNLVGQIMRNIPTGFNRHKKPQGSEILDKEVRRLVLLEDVRGLTETENIMYEEVLNAYEQIGTLGGGNHFIEIQEDEEGYLCVMLHSGSRNFGYKVAKYFNDLAKKLNKQWYSSVDIKNDLAFLPVDTREGQDYIRYMQLALDFAMENRQTMANIIKKELRKKLPHIEFKNEINAHHNYASLENHFGKNVWVHRKGAIRVRKDELGIIPSAMGGYSYIVEGLGNPHSFHSCSHGAGRLMSRKKAKEQFTAEQTIKDLQARGVILGKTNKSEVSDECIWAYKDIDFVISQELDLVKPIKKLKTICVIKG